MRKALISATLGLSVIASSLAISGSAKAFELVNYATINLPRANQKCLALKAGTANDGQPFIVYKCDGTASQHFSMSVYPDQPMWNPTVGVTSWMFSLAGYRQGVSVANNGNINGTPVILWREYYLTASAGQYWTPDATNSPRSGCYKFANPNSGNKVLSALGGSMADSTSVVIWWDFNSPTYHPDQYWCVQ